MPTLEDYLSIRNTIAQYCVALDAQDFDLLDDIFTPTAALDFSAAGLGVFTGVQEAKAALATFLKPLHTQHALTTQTLTFTSSSAPSGGAEKGEEEAAARTYVTAQHFGTGERAGQQCVVPAYYDDVLVKGEDGRWRIKKRTARLHHTPMGDVSLLQGS